MVFDEGEPVMDEDMASVMARLMDRMLQQEHDEMDGPHIVICRAAGTGVVSFQGPYPSGLAALIAADVEESAECSDGPRHEFSVAPLFPHSPPQS